MDKQASLQAYVDQELKHSFAISKWLGHVFTETLACRANYNHIFIIGSGSGKLQVDGSNYVIDERQLFLVAKGQLYSFHPGSLVNGYELVFGDCFWDKTPDSASNCKAVLFNNASANQLIPLSGDSETELMSLFQTLHGEFVQNDYPNKLDAMAAYLKIIMIKIANVNALLAKGYDTYENQLYRQYTELVSRQFHTTHEVADFARQLGISARKLSDLCRRCSGMGAKDIINGQLIAEAKRSLQFSSRPVKEIAFDLNFSTPDQFSHFFKKNTQVSPNDYRERFVNIGM